MPSICCSWLKVECNYSTASLARRVKILSSGRCLANTSGHWVRRLTMRELGMQRSERLLGIFRVPITKGREVGCIRVLDTNYSGISRTFMVENSNFQGNVSPFCRECFDFVWQLRDWSYQPLQVPRQALGIRCLRGGRHLSSIDGEGIGLGFSTLARSR